MCPARYEQEEAKSEVCATPSAGLIRTTLLLPDARRLVPNLPCTFIARPPYAYSTGGIIAGTGGVTMDNGTMVLGLNTYGCLIVPVNRWETQTVDNVTSWSIGLLYRPTMYDGVASAYPGEGWGVQDFDTGQGFGGANEAGTTVTSYSNSLTWDTSSNVAHVHTVTQSSGGFTVDHFWYSPNDNIFACDVVIQNTTGASQPNVVYRRLVDWDIEPTAFNEFITLYWWFPGSPAVWAALTGFGLNNPVQRSDPFGRGLGGPYSYANSPDPNQPDGHNWLDSGPDDWGACHDLGLGQMAQGATARFSFFYSVTATRAENEKLRPPNSVYSLATPSTAGNPALGTPNCSQFVYGQYRLRGKLAFGAQNVQVARRPSHPGGVS
jgi:hypothetical protein